MDRLTRTELESLTRPGAEPRVSIYLPLHRAYPRTQENPIRLRDLVDRAEQRLVAQGLRGRPLKSLLEPARGLIETPDFWQAGPAEGLAILLAPDVSRSCRLPYSCPELVEVGSGFYLAPLMRLLDWPLEFFLLALSENSVRLFHGTRASLSTVDLPAHTPHSLSEYLAGTEFGRPIRFQTAVGVGAAGAPTGIVHGQTSHRDDLKLRVHELVHAVAREIRPLIESQRIPLVLAAVQPLHSPLREAFRGLDLVEPGIYGSPDELNQPELLEQAVRLVDSAHEKELRATCEKYRRVTDKARGSRNIAQIVPAAAEGRVDSIIAAFGERVWGTWDPVRQHAERVDEMHPGRVDLLDLALRETFSHGGHVCVLPKEQMPENAPAVAVLRW